MKKIKIWLLLISLILALMPECVEAAAEDKKEANYNNLVMDAYSYTYTDVYGEKREYHIPKIGIDSTTVSQINMEIWNQLFPILDLEKGSNPYQEISYEWSVNGDILSLLVEVCEWDCGWSEYYIYNVTVSTGNIVSLNELLSYCGYTEQKYKDTVKLALGSRFWDYHDYIEENRDRKGFLEYANEKLAKTISDENVSNAKPYLNKKGELCISGMVYGFVAAEDYYNLCNLVDFEPSPYYEEKIDTNISKSKINISKEEAYKIAYKYWDMMPNKTEVDEEAGYKITVQYGGTVEKGGRIYYHFMLRWLVDNGNGRSHPSTIDQVNIDAETGECSL